MKIQRILLLTFLCSSLTNVSGQEISNKKVNTRTESYKNEPTLKEKHGWNIDSIASGIIRYHYTGYYEPIQAFQNINVLEVDLNQKQNNIKLIFEEKEDSLSAVGQRYKAFAGINGTYEPEASYVKIDGKFVARNILDNNHLRYWKHEGALFYDSRTKSAEIHFATDKEYEKSYIPNILSGAPMLIDNYNPVGLWFTGNTDSLCLESLPYEDYRRHQGVRHPRTAIALVKNKKLLLITVDGREKRAQGMSAAELTHFLRRYFDPQSALNIDGGGSTTMWIQDFKEAKNSIVNYPTDNKQFDHYGQRQVTSFILITQENNKK